jgi:hypothetical protein
MGFAKIHLVSPWLERCAAPRTTIAVQFHLGPLMGVMGVLGGQFVQAEQVLNLRHHGFVGFEQPQPDEGIWALRIAGISSRVRLSSLWPST